MPLHPQSVAIEHVLWACKDGQNPFMIFRALGQPWDREGMADWPDIERALMEIWPGLEHEGEG